LSPWRFGGTSSHGATRPRGAGSVSGTNADCDASFHARGYLSNSGRLAKCRRQGGPPGLVRGVVEWFPDEAACLDYLGWLRWPDGLRCPRCAGRVEVEETYVGGFEAGVDGRQTATKSVVAIAVEVKHPKGFGRIRLQRVDDVSKDSLIPFIESAVEPGATVHTDGWSAYWTVPEHGYEHDRTIMRGAHDPGDVLMPGVHRVASLHKRWMLGTHQGSVGSEHLDAYLNDSAFRFNRRHSRRRGLLSTDCSSSPSSQIRSPTAA
jgi:transposase-like protein